MLAVRENASTFTDLKQSAWKDGFELLLSVSGLVQKRTFNTQIAPIGTLKAIATGDISYMTKVSGIGKKDHRKIIVELKDKLKN